MRRLVLVVFSACLVACGGGGGQSGPTGPDPTPPPTPAPSPTPGPLTGHWVGLTSEGRGLIITDRTDGDYCINNYDWEGTLTHLGTELSGTMNWSFVGADCLSGRRRYHIPANALGDETPTPDHLALVVTPTGGVSMTWAEFVATVGGPAGQLNKDLAGTYTMNTIDLGGERAEGHSSWTVTFGLRRQ